MDIKELIASLAKYDEMEAPDGMNVAESVDGEQYNRQLLQERTQDAKNAIKDVLGYLKEFGEGDMDDIKALEAAIEALENIKGE